jgi:aspartyl-tRNA(Asn)/glutamyl-tRNA(Gln) amidotransferase subunit C
MSDIVSPEVTRKIAHLSRLKITDAEVEQYSKELGKILGLIAQLSEVNVDGVEPLVHAVQTGTHFREDIAIQLPEEEVKTILNCAEQSLYDQYKVPQVIGGE